jgi:phospholipase C
MLRARPPVTVVIVAAALVAVAAAAGCGPHRHAGSCDGPCPASRINHLVVIVQENHSFDSYFGRYCTAATGSAPACTTGPDCCEAGPTQDPSGAVPITLDDNENGAYGPSNAQACQLAEIDGGKMDRFASGGPMGCSDPRNLAYAGAPLLTPYWQLAATGALADRYFQPIAGATSSNELYFARAQFVFKDNDYAPDAIGHQCAVAQRTMQFPGPTIGDLLDGAGVSWAYYVAGYQAMRDAQKQGICPAAPDGCRFSASLYPCILDVGDLPIDYFASSKDNPRVLRDYDTLAADLQAGRLPQVVFVRGPGWRSEHPGLFNAISDGTSFVGALLGSLQKSDYAPDTLILLTWDESGGFYDHVAPPTPGSDGQPYGPRVPLIAIGPMAKRNFVSHETLEHSSLVKLIEWNWLGRKTGQLGGRDRDVANLGSLLDAAATGAAP